MDFCELNKSMDYVSIKADMLRVLGINIDGYNLDLKIYLKSKQHNIELCDYLQTKWTKFILCELASKTFKILKRLFKILF